MRVTIILLLLGVFQVSAMSGYSQQTRISIKLSNVRLTDVLNEVEDKSEFYFLYNQDLIDVNRIVSLKVENQKIDEILNQLFDETGVKYVIQDRQIILTNLDSNLQVSQPKEVKGKVTNESGEPVPGATVVVKGTTQGTITDGDGNYSLPNVPANATLQFSFVGMISREVEVGTKNTIDVVLISDAISIDEVIAVGYQTKHKKNLTGSVSEISSEQLENRPTAKLTSVLAGTAPGLIVTRSNPGRIGQTSESIRIGGITSRSNPGVLVVIDGIPQEGTTEALNSINPKDVESITVLKDAEAVIYGARASGGVLVVTTKRGSKPTLNASVSASFRVPHIYPKMTNILQEAEMLEEGWANNNITPLWGFPKMFKYIEDNNLTFDMIKNNDRKYVITDGAQFPDTPFLEFGHTDWMDLMYSAGISKNYDISASGSSDKTTYYASLGLVDEGTMLNYGTNTSYTYYTRLNYEYKHNDVIKVGANIALRYQKLTEPSAYGTIQSLTADKHTYDHPFTPEGRYMNWGGSQNPIGLAVEGGDHIVKFYDVKPQIYAELTPISSLKIRANFAKNASFRNGRSINKSFQHYYWNEQPSFLNRQPYQTNVSSQLIIKDSFTGNLQATFNKTIKERHQLRALAGISHEELSYDETTAWRNDLVYDELLTLNLGNSEEQYNSDNQTQVSIRSAFGNLSYSFDDRYVIEGNVRYDGSSRFAKGYKWKDFIGGGFAWNITNESFMKSLGLRNLSGLKLRSSWGQLGNQASIGLYDFVSRVNISQSSLILGDPTSVAKLQTATLSGFPSLTRTWEVTEKLNFGYDLEMFDNRLKSTANYFVTNTDNMFYSEEFPSVLGTTPPSINGAHVKTKGWDFSLEWNDNINNNFNYYVRFGITDARTKVISLADRRIVGYGYNNFVEGQPVGTIYGFDYDGLIQDDADRADYLSRITAGITRRVGVGDAKYKDLDGDGIIESAQYKLGEDGQPTSDSGDLIDLGDAEQHYIYHFALGFRWKGLDLSMVLNGVGEWYAWERNASELGKPWIQPLEHYYNNTWSPDRPNAKYPRLNTIGSDFKNDRNDNNYRFSNALYVQQNVPYLAINNIRLGYTIPKAWSKRMKMNKLYIYANIDDLGYVINKMPDSYSPEQPFTMNITPYPQIFSFGLDVNF